MSDELMPQRESSLFDGAEEVAKPKVKAPSLMDQFIGVFTEPTELFKKLNAAPAWGWAAGALTVSSLVLIVAWGLKVDVDAMMRPALEQNAQLSGTQIDQVIDFQTRFLMPLAILGVLFGTPFTLLLGALLRWVVGLGTAEAEKPTFMQALSATSVSGLVMVPYALLTSLMCWVHKVGGLAPEKLSPTSVAFYLRPENPKLYGLYAQLDIFVLFGFVLVYLSSRHTLRLKASGAAINTALGVLMVVVFKILLAK